MACGAIARLLRAGSVTVVAASVWLTGCSGMLKKEYEYEEELYPALDGSTTLYVNASVPALVALGGADLDVNPRARLDRNRVRAMFEGPGVEVVNVSTSRRHGRRFIHVRIEAGDLRALATVRPLAWSTYRFERDRDVFEFRQTVGSSTGGRMADVGWTGQELVAFRLHVPSRIRFHNSPDTIQRGNILTWEQPLAERLKGVPLDLQVHMETESILFRTLLLFASTIVAAALTFAVVIWWIARRGRAREMAESRP